MADFGGYCEVCGRRCTDAMTSIDGAHLICTPCAMDQQKNATHGMSSHSSDAVEDLFRSTRAWYGLTGVHPGQPVLR